MLDDVENILDLYITTLLKETGISSIISSPDSKENSDATLATLLHMVDDAVLHGTHIRVDSRTSAVDIFPTIMISLFRNEESIVVTGDIIPEKYRRRNKEAPSTNDILSFV